MWCNGRVDPSLRPGAPAAPFTLAALGGAAPIAFGAAGAGALAPPTLLFFWKHDCPTCDLVAPLVQRVHAALGGAGLRTLGVSQSDAAESAAFATRHGLGFDVALDAELDASAAWPFDAVPGLALVARDGRLVRVFEGFGRDDFLALVADAAAACGAPAPAIEQPGERFPENRPGCGSRVHDPEVAQRLAVKRGEATLAARRVRIPVADDPFEFLSEQGVTDGLPVVPPTEARVVRMLSGTRRAPSDVVALVPPNLAPATVEKIAINAVMAGCEPAYLPVVIAALEAACTDEFNLHGVLATTYFPTPVVVVNGPIRRAIGLNCGANVFGQGFRANATIGRALQLVVRNVGGGKPGELDMCTLGHAGKFGCCIGENEEESPWEPLHVERGFRREQSTVTVFAGEAPRAILDQTSRSARSLATSFGLCLDAVAHPKFHGYGEVMLVVSPEHCRTLEQDGWSKAQVRARIQEVTRRPLAECLPDETCAEGIPVQALPPALRGPDGAPKPEVLGFPVPKFRRDEEILLVVAGGTAGKFSAVLGGWVGGAMGSVAVTREIGA
jgi:peroxiredoxin